MRLLSAHFFFLTQRNAELVFISSASLSDRSARSNDAGWVGGLWKKLQETLLFLALVTRWRQHWAKRKPLVWVRQKLRERQMHWRWLPEWLMPRLQVMRIERRLRSVLRWLQVLHLPPGLRIRMRWG
jgi:hypothetical protein